MADQTLPDAPGIDAVSIADLTATAVRAASARLRRTERPDMSGRIAPVVPDGAGLALADNCAVRGTGFPTCQGCAAFSRLMVTERSHDAFLSAPAERVATLEVGHVPDPATKIDPAADEGQPEQDLHPVTLVRDEGAERVTGDNRANRNTKGDLLHPALLVGAPGDMRSATQKAFGPVACAARMQDCDGARTVANGTESGLCARIMTRNPARATHVRQAAGAGIAMVNLPTAGVGFHIPAGGCKTSGPGEQGTCAAKYVAPAKRACTLAGKP
ncbi:MAG: aldehyde dehydrogenase family protein [Rhodobacter sp.]|nr:aldehyde dehydrogenase family protein [Rhodobacter sp.]